MPDYSYTARDAEGQKVSGTITAEGQREAMATLASRSLFPLEIHADTPVVENQRVRRVPAQLMATTYGQLADLLRSGVPLLRALAVLQKQTSHPRLNYVLSQIHRHVEDGSTLAEAMARFPRVFGDMAISMIRAGGEGGFLEEALARVADFTEAQEDLRKRTTGAMVYPAVLAVFGTVVVFVLIVFFVPKFAMLFERLREQNQLPIVTEALLWTSATLGRWFLPILGLAAIGVWYIRRRLGTEEGKLLWDRIRIRLPLVGPIFLSLAVARFCRVLGTLLRNGVPIIRALEIASSATANRVLGAAIREATEDISAGQPLAGPLAASGQFPPLVVEMIGVAEQSNTLEGVLISIADSLERRTWRRLDLAVRLIEPLLLMVLASVILVVVVALLLPVLRMSTSVG